MSIVLFNLWAVSGGRGSPSEAQISLSRYKKLIRSDNNHSYFFTAETNGGGISPKNSSPAQKNGLNSCILSKKVVILPKITPLPHPPPRSRRDDEPKTEILTY